MVLIAILYGVSMFRMHYEAAQRDALISELNYIHLRTYVHWIRTTAMEHNASNYWNQLCDDTNDDSQNVSWGDWLGYDDFTYAAHPGSFFSSKNGVFTVTTEYRKSSEEYQPTSFIVIYAAGQVSGKDKSYLNVHSWGNSTFLFPDGSGRRGSKGLVCYKTTFNLQSGEVTIDMLN